jgi:hypothetical protein
MLFAQYQPQVVLALIANNKGTFNPPALQSAFQKISLTLSFALARLFAPSSQIFGV